MSNEPAPSAHFPTDKFGTGADPLPLSGHGADPTPPIATQTSAPRVNRATAKATESESRDDARLVDETKNQIRTLVQEIAELASTDCSVEEFYEGFLTRTTNALASTGGAIWISPAPDQPLQLEYHINLKATGLVDNSEAQETHHRLLTRLQQRGEAVLIRPDSALAKGDRAGNPTESLLVIGPLKVDQQIVGLVEIFQRPGAGPTTQRGYLRFLSQMCEIASTFLCHQEIRSYHQQQKLWQQLDQFTQQVYQGLDTSETVFTIANEGRRLIGCDRVSVALARGRQCRVQAVSGLDSIERRAEQVKLLGQLAAAVIKTGQPLWYDGDADELPPQLETRLQHYLDRSHSSMLAIIPLQEKLPEEAIDRPRQAQRQPQTIGALIVEQLKDSRVSTTLQSRVEFVAQHGQAALTNTREHQRIFLLPLWKSIGGMTSLMGAGKRLKTMTVLACLAGAIAFLVLFPYSFGLSANGRLIPETKFEVFAQSDGTIAELAVSDTADTLVRQGQLLGTMKNSDVDLAISGINGQIAESKARIAAIEQRLAGGGLDADEQYELEAELKSAEQSVSSLTYELGIRREEQEMLKIVSPANGQVVTWNARQNLLNRPVKQGQNLLTIVPPDTVWQLELQMPERRLKHLFETMQHADGTLPVTFALVSNPGTEYEGRLLKVDRKLDVYSDDGNAALIWVAFDNQSIDEALLRSETRVTAQVQCGQRSIGFVMFHELFETVQTQWMLWF